jgi:small GTP-binding protein
MHTNDSMIGMLFDKVLKRVEEEKNAPLKIAIMGQTGVGKTSLVNALFNAKLEKGPVEPTTQDIIELEFKREGYELKLYDLPGIGESKGKDVEYLKKYRQKLIEADIVIWAIHADSRSFVYDLDALNKILETADEQFEKYLFRKITFVLTKADLLIEDYETSSPWILADFGKYATFTPQKSIKDLLARKEAYIQKIFILSKNDLLVSQTFHDKNFKIEAPSLSYDHDRVYYQGVLDEENLAMFIKDYPQQRTVFERLYNNYRVISCSARFQYNLDLLMEVITSKLDLSASLKFSNFLIRDVLNRVPIAKARNYSNLIIIDQVKKRIIFDLARLTLSENEQPRSNRWGIRPLFWIKK